MRRKDYSKGDWYVNKMENIIKRDSNGRFLRLGHTIYKNKCTYCNKDYYTEKKNAKFCSKDCFYKNRDSKIIIECVTCGKDFKKNP